MGHTEGTAKNVSTVVILAKTFFLEYYGIDEERHWSK